MSFDFYEVMKEKQELQDSKCTPIDVNKEYYAHEIIKPVYDKDDKVLIIDGDILTYKVAAIGDVRCCKVTKDGKSKEFSNKTDFKRICEANGWDYSSFEVEDILKPEPIEYCLGTLKAAINNILERTGCTKYEIYIGGGGNFRLNLDLPTQYKSARTNQLRPTYLTDCKEYLIKWKGAIKIKGREADDYVQQRMYELHQDCVEALAYSNDKDIRQEYRYNIRVFNPDDEKITTYKCHLGEVWLQPNGDVKGSGLKWLIGQTLFGDSTDNYKGNQLSGVRFGEKTYYKDVKDILTVKELLEYAVSKWKSWYPEPIKYETWDGREVEKSWLELANMYMSCAYMLISDNDDTTFESLLQEYGIEY